MMQPGSRAWATGAERICQRHASARVDQTIADIKPVSPPSRMWGGWAWTTWDSQKPQAFAAIPGGGSGA